MGVFSNENGLICAIELIDTQKRGEPMINRHLHCSCDDAYANQAQTKLRFNDLDVLNIKNTKILCSFQIKIYTKFSCCILSFANGYKYPQEPCSNRKPATEGIRDRIC